MKDILEKTWWQSKKFWIWLISFIGMFAALIWSLGGDWRVSVALVVGASCVSMTGMLGLAWVDAVVRFARAWNGQQPTIPGPVPPEDFPQK